ncbi:MAG: Solute carrier family 35 member [Streblomastix strix]|uniref:Solute carrier family 35 member n=1 Tax=Streblomastix strix TaxID=222440 RepID=A0A5J4TZG9_9EUKA|nr:MAG: Solute carrier family 35 member [Streblomastix strix]
MASILTQILLSSGMLLTGSLNTISKKLQYQSCAPGLDVCKGSPTCNTLIHKNNHHFEKPWTQTSMMFLGEATCIIVYLLYKLCTRKPSTSELKAHRKAKIWEFVRLLPLFALLGFFDLLGTTGAAIGLLFVPSSIYQLFRGSIILFTSIWSVLLLKRKFYWYNWTGIVMVIFGLAVVGLSGLLNNSLSSQKISAGKYIFGIIIIILGQLACSTQV